MLTNNICAGTVLPCFTQCLNAQPSNEVTLAGACDIGANGTRSCTCIYEACDTCDSLGFQCVPPSTPYPLECGTYLEWRDCPVSSCSDYCTLVNLSPVTVIGSCDGVTHACVCQLVPPLCDCTDADAAAGRCVHSDCSALCPNNGFCNPTTHTCMCFPCESRIPRCDCDPELDATCAPLNCSLVCVGSADVIAVCDQNTGGCRCTTPVARCDCPAGNSDATCVYVDCNERCSGQEDSNGPFVALACNDDGTCLCRSAGGTECLPQTCENAGYLCGSLGDGCGSVLNCGNCSADALCLDMHTGCEPLPACAPQESCGNGVIDAQFGEECDDGEALNGRSDSLCTPFCTRARCGDAFWSPAAGEQCDPGTPASASPYCRANCMLKVPPPPGNDNLANDPFANADAAGTGGNSVYCTPDTVFSLPDWKRGLTWALMTVAYTGLAALSYYFIFKNRKGQR